MRLSQLRNFVVIVQKIDSTAINGNTYSKN